VDSSTDTAHGPGSNKLGVAPAYSRSSLWRKFRACPFDEKRAVLADLLRWLCRYRHFKTRHPVLLGSRVRLNVRQGRITTGGICIIRSDCQFGIVGEDGKTAQLHIGEGADIGQRTIINARDHVHIGDRCSISWDCDICDSDFHQIILGDGSRPPKTEPVVIEDDVWIGNHAMVFKGVHIGHHSVIGAGAVVRHDIPPYSLVVGNPARRVAKIDGWER